MFLKSKFLMHVFIFVFAPNVLFAAERLDYISIERFKAAVGLLMRKEFNCTVTNGGVQEANIRGRVRAQSSYKDKSFFVEIHLAPNRKAHVYFNSTNYNQPPAWAANWPEYYRDQQSLVYRGYQGVFVSDLFIIDNLQGTYPIEFSYNNNLGVDIDCKAL